jgi:hypothetical protein
MTSHLASVGATFSRASIGTYTDANGLIQEASAGQARPNYSTAGVHEGLLIEESRTNLIKSSEQITTDWAQVGVSEFENYAIVSPNGKVNGVKISSNNISFQSRHEYTLTLTDNTDYSFTVFLKKASSQYGLLRFTTKDGTNNNVSVDFNASPVAISTDTTSSATLEDYGNDWYKVSMTVDSASGGTSPEIAIWGNTSDNFAIANPIGADVYFFGAQVEEGSFPTSYIPTIPTFSSRASTATFFNSSGVLSTASTNVARTDHKYIDGQWVEAGLLLEGASTNLHLNSGDLTGNNSATNEVSLSLQTVTNPIDGQSQVTRIADNAVNDAHFIQSGTVTADGSSDYTFSILAKAGTLSTCRIIITGGGVFGVEMIVDLSDGSILSGSGTVEDVANGWYILSVTGTSTASSALATRVYTTDGTNVTYTGSGEYINVAYRQLEVGSQPTSYIPTSGATADRALDDYTTQTKERSADVCYIDGTAFTDFYNQEQGTFFVFWQGFTDGGVDRWIGVHDSSKANVFDDRIIFAFSTSAESIRLTISDDGVVQTNSVIDTDVAQTTPSKYALAVKLNDVNSYQDGVEVVSDSSVTMPSADKLIFHNGAGVRPFQGYIRKLIYFPRRLDNNELIKLTQ